MMPGYGLHPGAEADLLEIWEYIAAESPSAADRVIDEIEQALIRLVRFPYQGHRRPDLTGRQLRFITVRDYLIAYAPDPVPLWVIAVIHGYRNPLTITSILSARDR